MVKGEGYLKKKIKKNIFRNKRVAQNYWSLLHNVTNNLAEDPTRW
jgi:hypothetical protein